MCGRVRKEKAQSDKQEPAGNTFQVVTSSHALRCGRALRHVETSVRLPWPLIN